jgi:segregation and condensation protein B
MLNGIIASRWFNLQMDDIKFKADYSMTEGTISKPQKHLSLCAQIEALLFVAPGAVTISQLSTALGETIENIEKKLDELEHGNLNRGIRLQRHRGRVQLVSAPEAAPLVEHFLGLEATTRMSRAALEAMSIIAYQQPVTRPQIDAIRGVNSDGVLKTLLSKGLIQEVGRAPGPGRPILYSTTPEFLGYFGLTSLDELPPLNLSEIINGEVDENERSLNN